MAKFARPCVAVLSIQVKIYSNKKTARISIFHKKNTDSGSSIPGLL